MLYIWDPIHNLKKGKHITAWIKNGVVYYEEQFPNQLKTFYDGVKGYLYKFPLANDCMQNSEGMYYSENSIEILSFEKIENVYSELCEYIQKGDMKIITFNQMTDERREGLHNSITNRIMREKLVENPNSDEAGFYKKYFPAQWQRAKQQYE